MSRIKRDLKEKKIKKLEKKEEAKNDKAKKEKSNSNSKLPFMKISRKNNYYSKYRKEIKKDESNFGRCRDNTFS